MSFGAVAAESVAGHRLKVVLSTPMTSTSSQARVYWGNATNPGPWFFGAGYTAGSPGTGRHRHLSRFGYGRRFDFQQLHHPEVEQEDPVVAQRQRRPETAGTKEDA